MKFIVKTYRFIREQLHHLSSLVTNLYAFTSASASIELLLLGGQLTLSGLFLQGCVREQMDDCVQYELTISAVDPQGVDVTSSGTVTSIDLYLFDESGFVRTIPRGSSSDFLFGTEKNKTLTLVAWGNLKGDSLELPQLSVGTSLQNAKIGLLQTATGYKMPVTDLFYSRQEFNNPSTRGLQNDTVKLVMERLVAALSVRIDHASEYFGNSSTNLHIVVRGTGSSLNFLGEPSDDEAGYIPPMVSDTGKDEWTAPLFRVFPTNETQQIYIDLYRGDTLLFTISTDDEGNTLHALPGKETYITVDFRSGRMHVAISVKPWDAAGQETEL